MSTARVMPLLKRVAARLPEGTQHELRRLFFRQQIRRRTFFSNEKEYALLDTLLKTGDWALDIGANVGHYCMRMAELVGPSGRVIAFEPVPETFALLSANARLLAHANVTLLNVAASDRTDRVGMEIPRWSEGSNNYYQAHIVGAATNLTILTLAVDSLALPTISLVKIDAEGHELSVLQGMRLLIERDRPVLILETSSANAADFMTRRGYITERLPGSSNLLCRPCARRKQP